MLNKFLAAIGVVALAAALVADIPSLNPPSQTFSSAASPAYCVQNSGQATTAFQASSGTPGPIDVTISPQQNTGTPGPASVFNAAGTQQSAAFTPSVGTFYRIQTMGAVNVCIAPDAAWSGQNVTMTMWSNGSAESFAGLAGGGGSGGNVTIVAPTANTFGVNGVNVNVLNSPLPAGPLPTAVAGSAPPASTSQMITYPACFNYAPGVVSITNTTSAALRCDTRAHLQTAICGNNLNQCATIAQGQTNALTTAPMSAQTTTVTTTTCTNVFATAVILAGVTYPSETANTGILSVYNEASALCTSNPIYTTAAAVTAPTYTPFIFFLTSGMSYKWSAAPTAAAEILTI